jgi:hypothetical protein
MVHESTAAHAPQHEAPVKLLSAQSTDHWARLGVLDLYGNVGVLVAELEYPGANDEWSRSESAAQAHTPANLAAS